MMNVAETANSFEEKVAMMIESKVEEQVMRMDMEAKKAARRKARQEALATERKAFIQARKEARKAALEARKAERRVERKAAKIAANKDDDKKVVSSTESETDVDAAADAAVTSPDHPMLVKLQNRAAMKRQRQAKARAVVQARKKELIAAREAFIEGQKEAVRAERRANRQAKNKAARQAERKAARQAARESRKSNALIEIQEGIELVKEVDDRSAQMARREARMKKRIEERKAELQALKETRKRIRREAKREKQAVLAAAAVAVQKKAESPEPVNNEKLDDMAKELNDLKLAGENKIETEAVATAVAKDETGSKNAAAAAQKARRAARIAELRMKKKQLANDAGAKKRARQLVAKAVNRAFAVGSDPVMIQDDVFVVKAVNDAGTILIEIAKKGNEPKTAPVEVEKTNVDSVAKEVVEEKDDAGFVDAKMDLEAKVAEANESAQKESMEEETAVANDKKSGSDGSDWEVVDDTAKAKAAKREARKQARQNLRKQARRDARKEKKLAAAENAGAAGPAGADEVAATSADEWETVVAA